MNWRNDPATEKQLICLRQFGYCSEAPLTKGEASDLITQFLENPERKRIYDQNRAEAQLKDDEEQERNRAHYLHLEYEEAKLSLTKAQRGDIRDSRMYLRDTENERLYFWRDAFRPPDEMEEAGSNEQTIKLYFAQGHRFKMPTKRQLLLLLEALDTDSKTWDLDMPEYFFHALEHNFPELLRRSIDYRALQLRREVYSHQ